MIPHAPGGKPAALLLLSLLALAPGCTVVDAVRPTPPEPRLDAPIAATWHFSMSDGAVLPARAWPPPPGIAWRGVILALHGYTDSRDAWEVPAPAFAQAGYAVYAPDQRGFGQAPNRGGWAGTQRMVDDAAELVAQLRARRPGLPIIVLGESMGGAVAMLLAARPAATADSYILEAPAVWGWRQMNPALAATLLAADAVAPNWSPPPGQIGRDFAASDNYPALERMGRDPLTLRHATVASLRGLVDLMAEAQAASGRVHGSVLVLAGRRDQLVPPAATAAAWARLPPSVRRAFYPNGYHLLLRDHDRALVIADILSWLRNPDAWLPSGADAAAAAWQAGRAWQARDPALTPAGAADTDFRRPAWPY
jgi:alpha-beta hydrolase superfamily lysophospholipase